MTWKEFDMATYLITYKKRRAKKEAVVEMPNETRMLSWIAKNAGDCDSVLIQRCDA